MNVSRLMLSLLLMSAFMETKAQMTVEVTNPSNEYREEVIELPLEEVCKRLKTTCDSIRVLDRAGLDIPCQWTHDGKLLIGATERSTLSERMTLPGKTIAVPTEYTDLLWRPRVNVVLVSMSGLRIRQIQ